MRTCISMSSLSGEFSARLGAIASAGFDAIELLEGDILLQGGDPAEVGRGRQRAPFGRPQPHDAPTLLVDEHGQAARAAEGMDRLGECLQLRPVDAVALEQDHAGRRQGEQKLTLRRGELRAGDAHHRGAGYGPAPGGQTHWAIGPTMKH